MPLFWIADHFAIAIICLDYFGLCGSTIVDYHPSSPARHQPLSHVSTPKRNQTEGSAALYVSEKGGRASGAILDSLSDDADPPAGICACSELGCGNIVDA